MSKVAGVQDERRRCRQRIHFGDRFAQGSGHISVRRLVEADMAVTDLYKAEVAFEIANLLAHDVAQGEGLHNTTLKHAERPGARPAKTLQKAPPRDAILVQLFVDA